MNQSSMKLVFILAVSSFFFCETTESESDSLKCSEDTDQCELIYTEMRESFIALKSSNSCKDYNFFEFNKEECVNQSDFKEVEILQPGLQRKSTWSQQDLKDQQWQVLVRNEPATRTIRILVMNYTLSESFPNDSQSDVCTDDKIYQKLINDTDRINLPKLYSEITTIIQMFPNQRIRIIIAGKSFGGTIAFLISTKLRKHCKKQKINSIVGTHTFNEPTVLFPQVYVKWINLLKVNFYYRLIDSTNTRTEIPINCARKKSPAVMSVVHQLGNTNLIDKFSQPMFVFSEIQNELEYFEKLFNFPRQNNKP